MLLSFMKLHLSSGLTSDAILSASLNSSAGVERKLVSISNLPSPSVSKLSARSFVKSLRPSPPANTDSFF